MSSSIHAASRGSGMVLPRMKSLGSAFSSSSSCLGSYFSAYSQIACCRDWPPSSLMPAMSTGVESGPLGRGMAGSQLSSPSLRCSARRLARQATRRCCSRPRSCRCSRAPRSAQCGLCSVMYRLLCRKATRRFCPRTRSCRCSRAPPSRLRRSTRCLRCCAAARHRPITRRRHAALSRPACRRSGWPHAHRLSAAAVARSAALNGGANRVHRYHLLGVLTGAQRPSAAHRGSVCHIVRVCSYTQHPRGARQAGTDLVADLSTKALDKTTILHHRAALLRAARH